jgi:hypothetical protein
MASDKKQEKVQHDEGQEHAANADATHREACEYWGYLLKPDIADPSADHATIEQEV